MRNRSSRFGSPPVYASTHRRGTAERTRRPGCWGRTRAKTGRAGGTARSAPNWCERATRPSTPGARSGWSRRTCMGEAAPGTGQSVPNAAWKQTLTCKVLRACWRCCGSAAVRHSPAARCLGRPCRCGIPRRLRPPPPSPGYLPFCCSSSRTSSAYHSLHARTSPRCLHERVTNLGGRHYFQKT